MAYTQEWPITVRCDQNINLRQVFLDWENNAASLYNNAGGLLGTFASTVDAKMILLGEDNQKVMKKYILRGVFPTNTGNIQFDQGNNGIATFNVTLTFQYWYDEDSGDPLA